MCFIVEVSKVVDLSLYIELKNPISLGFHFDYFKELLSRSSIFEGSRFSNCLKEFN